MTRSLRTLRGVTGIGLTWGILWAAIFAAITIVVWVIDPEDIDPGEGPIRVGAIGGAIGLVSGVLFGTLLAFTERRRAVRDIALVRAAIWGAIAAAAIPLLTGRQDQVFVLCPIGAALAMAAVAIARKAASRDPRQPKRAFDVVADWVFASVRDTVNPAPDASMH
jgi:hypothetical protein